MEKKRLFWLILVLFVVLSGCSTTSELDELEEWDLVWITDSSGWDVAQVYADYIEEDTGKTVIVHDQWVGALSAGQILDALNGNPRQGSRQLQEIASLIPDAEVIVIFGNPMNSFDEGNPWDFNCVGGTLYVNNCDLDAFNVYVEDLSAIYQKIFDLRGDKPTIIRAIELYNPIIPNRVGEAGYEECISCWRIFNQVIHMAAEQNNIPVAEVANAWNGPDYLLNPVDLGYTKDGEHPSELGTEVIAQTFRDLGYAPVKP